MAYKAFSKVDNNTHLIEFWLRKKYEETPYCPICGEETNIHAKTSEVRRTHFRHVRGSSCPSIEKNRELYKLLAPIERDTENAKELKKWFKANPYVLYTACKEILNNKYLPFREFKEMIRAANDKQIWYLKGLNEEKLPYVLMVNFGVFPAIKDKGRKENFYFIFDKNTKGNDLFLEDDITHIWKIKPSEKDFDKIEIKNLVEGSSKPYFWDSIQEFYR